jgi:hypothetical protein
MKIVLAFVSFLVVLLASCSSWVFDSETRLQLLNETGSTVWELSVVAPDGELRVWIPDTLAPGGQSKVYTGAWVGTFSLGVFIDGNWQNLGPHEIEGGSVHGTLRSTNGGGLELILD